jgi:biopolymer transport protein ExbB/TolQ
MNRTEFVIAIAVILFLAFLLGWVACWLVNRLSRVTENDMTELDSMAQALHEAEEQRDQAIAYLHHREDELQTKLTQTEAEAKAAMEGLREARREASELRGYIENLNA